MKTYNQFLNTPFSEEVKPPEPPTEEEDPGIKSKEKRQMQIKKQVLLKKMQAVRAGAGADIVAGYEPEGEELKEYSPNVTYQAKGGKKSGKLGKSSVYSLRGKDESKKDFRKSHVKDIEGGYVGGGHKPTPGNLKKEGVVLEKKKQPSVHDDYYDPMEDPTFDPHEAEATRGQSGRGTKGKMNVRKKYPVK